MGRAIIEKQLKAVVLDFRKLSGRHTTEAISAVVKDVVLQCGLVGRVRAITSDAAAVNVKAVKLLACDDEFTDGREICHLLCGAQKLHLSVVNSLSVWGRSSSDVLSSDSVGNDGDVERGRAPESQPESGESDLSDWLNGATDTESEDVDEKCDMAWSSRVERQVRRNNLPLLATLIKLRARGRLVRRSNIAWSELEGCIKKEKESIGDSTKVKIIPRDIITRWNSTIFLIRWFLDDANKKGFINFRSICIKRRPSDNLRKHMARYKLDFDDFANAENVHCVVTDIEPVIRSLVTRLSSKTEGHGRLAKMSKGMCDGNSGILIQASTYLHPRYASTEGLAASQAAVKQAAVFFGVDSDSDEVVKDDDVDANGMEVNHEDGLLSCLNRRELTDQPVNISILDRELDIYKRDLHSGKWHGLVD
ncbi:hypothetical protein FOZ60_008378 [Perkinsus olseni]|uniref:Uncharacterized protein n=1 Tax=Perkinsus olseni TaxID=32597 RepID=A0A7J6NJA2_PEROL|nr:hypothetical protein FOZ60_008378 [Perkinsus olseni]